MNQESKAVVSIVEGLREVGRGTVRQIAEESGYSSGTVHNNMGRLKELGVIDHVGYDIEFGPGRNEKIYEYVGNGNELEDQ